MRKLNENCVYSLEELTSEERNELGNNININISNKYIGIAYYNDSWNGIYWKKKDLTHNAKELFYTLENVQVDCRELSEEQIKEMVNVFEISGYKPSNLNEKSNLEVKWSYLFLKLFRNKFIVGTEDEEKTTITYEKFMELFANQVTNESEDSKVISNNTEQDLEMIDNQTPDVSKMVSDNTLLQEAEAIINGARAEDYGSVTENFSKIAVGWREIFADGKFTPRQVAHAMIWLKTCRDLNTPKYDNILDIAGYAGCVGKMIEEENEANH